MNVPSLCLCALLLCGSLPVWSEDPPDARQKVIKQLIHQLASDEYKLRHQADARLREIGHPALDALMEATESPSKDLAFRVQRLIDVIKHEELTRGFTAIAQVKLDHEIDLEKGMWLIARILDHRVEEEGITQELDRLAARVRKQLKGVDPKAAAPPVFIDALIHVLRDEKGLRGNKEDYDNPDNSSIERVLATGKGLPILLSQIAISVAARLDVRIDGLGVPGRFMIMYKPPGAQDGWVVSPFDDWRITRPGERGNVVLGLAQMREEDLSPETRRETLSRMIRNLASDYTAAGMPQQAAIVRGYEDLVDDD